MQQRLFQKAAATLAAATTEASFWDAFVEATREIESWPHGWVMLGTPSMPYACLRHLAAESRFSLAEAGTIGGTPTLRRLGIEALGHVRRDIRSGQFVVSARDVMRQWHVLHDARDTRTQFTEPMLSWFELGFEPANGDMRAAA